MMMARTTPKCSHSTLAHQQLPQQENLSQPFIVSLCMKSQVIWRLRSFFVFLVAEIPWFFTVFSTTTTIITLLIIIMIVVIIGRIGRRLSKGTLFVKNTTSFGRFSSHPFVIDHTFVPSPKSKRERERESAFGRMNW
jgi:hypothetical protein